MIYGATDAQNYTDIANAIREMSYGDLSNVGLTPEQMAAAIQALKGKWGKISGTLTDQTDLKNSLDGKLSIENKAGFKNSVFRGKSLGSTYTQSQQSQVSAGIFDDLFLGDFWTINGINYRIAGFDYLLKSGQTATNAHHLLIFPDSYLLAPDGSTTHYMNDTNTTEGGYKATNMRSIYLPQCLTMVETAFGASHILNHYEYISNAVEEGKASGGEWTQTKIEIPNEMMIYGGIVRGQSVSGLENVGNMWQQMPLSLVAPEIVRNRLAYWLRDVVSASNFANVNYNGNANSTTASNANNGVRPFFLLS